MEPNSGLVCDTKGAQRETPRIQCLLIFSCREVAIFGKKKQKVNALVIVRPVAMDSDQICFTLWKDLASVVCDWKVCWRLRLRCRGALSSLLNSGSTLSKTVCSQQCSVIFAVKLAMRASLGCRYAIQPSHQSLRLMALTAAAAPIANQERNRNQNVSALHERRKEKKVDFTQSQDPDSGWTPDGVTIFSRSDTPGWERWILTEETWFPLVWGGMSRKFAVGAILRRPGSPVVRLSNRDLVADQKLLTGGWAHAIIGRARTLERRVSAFYTFCTSRYHSPFTQSQNPILTNPSSRTLPSI